MSEVDTADKDMSSALKFGPFSISRSQVFYQTKLSYAFVNLRPLTPGHSLICPLRTVPRLSQLTDEETVDLFLTAKRMSRMLERVYKADALNFAVQDGVESGQSVPHVHVHLIPRRKGDRYSGNDQLYDDMENGDEGNLGRAFELMQARRAEKTSEPKVVGSDGDAGRKDRSHQEMDEEAAMLRAALSSDADKTRL